MIRVIVLYEQEPEPERYEQHVDLCRNVDEAIFRDGPIFGAPGGAPKYKHYAEFEFPDQESFNRASASPEFQATGTDAAAMGIPFTVMFADVE